MVSLLRRPLGFAFIYMVLATLLGMYLKASAFQPEVGTIVIAGVLLLFTLVYVFLVQAHLSNDFRLRASIYIALISLIAILGGLALVDINSFNVLIKDYKTWVNVLVQFIVSYVAITIGNWFASLVFKGKGHI